MKKKIALFIFVALVISKTFAGEYVYWEKHAKQNSNFTFHCKICMPKKSANETTANETFQRDIDAMLKYVPYIQPDETLTLYETYILLPNGYTYKVSFVWTTGYYGSVGTGIVSTTKTNSEIGEVIYNINNSSFNYCYEIYQDQCNKYLNMY